MVGDDIVNNMNDLLDMKIKLLRVKHETKSVTAFAWKIILLTIGPRVSTTFNVV